MTAEEREAANLVVEQISTGGRGGGGGRGGPPGGGGGGGGRGAQSSGALTPSLPDEFNAEFSILLGKHKTALEIRDFLSGEFTPLPLADVMAVLRAREAQGSIKLVPKR
jgi:aminopeptidase YwaD